MSSPEENKFRTLSRNRIAFNDQWSIPGLLTIKIQFVGMDYLKSDPKDLNIILGDNRSHSDRT